MLSTSPFHAGEQVVQARLGVRDDIEPWARQVVRPYLPEEHRRFHTSLPFLVAAARDKKGRPWATLLTGPRGFVRSPDPHLLLIHARPVPGDALDKSFSDETSLGLLGIELETRRRNRVNGRVTSDDTDALRFEVDQSFGNCPQYIHPRSLERVTLPVTPIPARRSDRLTASTRHWIESADTFFIASGHQDDTNDPRHGMDASHRGGDPGFVRVESDIRLIFPDYAGNNHFNTIGNLVLDSRAGLTFVDFEGGGLLQLTGRAAIDWDSDAAARVFPGARRLVSFDVEEVVELESALPLRWSSSRDAVRTLRLIDKVRESEDVTSFVFEPRDGGALADFEAGQHLPIELEIPDREEPVRRTYSISSGPNATSYRISVKRETLGVALNYLHLHARVGDFVNAHVPAGEFTLAKSQRPVMLISAGIGSTPMVSMLGALSAGPDERCIWFVHGARDGDHHPLAEEVRLLIEQSPEGQAHVRYSAPRKDDRIGRDYHSRGRVDAELIATLLPALDAEFYICGPTSFMSEIQLGLVQRGVPVSRIHTETFGPIG